MFQPWGDDLDIVVVRQPGDLPRLAQAAILGAIGLNDIDGLALDPGLKRLTSNSSNLRSRRPRACLR